jgi:UPF0271 protein
MGESFALYTFGADAELVKVVDAANIACGFHASDYSVMRASVKLARSAGVAIGAHPSLPDRQGFGRRKMDMSRQEITDCIIYQVGALKGFLEAEGGTLSHIKPHGALYGMSARDPDVAHAVADALDVFSVPVFGLEGTLHQEVFPQRGHHFVSEFFPDLEYDDEGALVITRSHDSCAPDLIRERVTRALCEGRMITSGGKSLPVTPGTICIHSDTPNAAELAAAAASAMADWKASASTNNSHKDAEK